MTSSCNKCYRLVLSLFKKTTGTGVLFRKALNVKKYTHEVPVKLVKTAKNGIAGKIIFRRREKIVKE